MKKLPKILVLEGLDNSGKTKQAEKLEEYFKNKNKKVLVSKELTTEIGKLIKSYRNNSDFTPVLKTFLFAADREKRIAEINEKDHEVDYIIFDRYIHSAIAYRSADRGLDNDWVKEVNKCFKKPDIGFYIDITPEESYKRTDSKKDNIPYGQDVLTKIRETYNNCVEKGELIFINGMQTENEVLNDLIKHIEHIL